MQKRTQAVMRITTALSLMLSPSLVLAQRDTGVRGGAPGAGGPVSGIQINELALFREGIIRVTQLEAVCDTCGDLTDGATSPESPFLMTKTNSTALGARFNGDQCSVCHSQPAIGGSGGFLVPNPQDPPGQYRAPENPMFNLIPHRKGGTNYVPSFITQYGPIREVRFVNKTDGSGPDGGVHQLFTVLGRTDTASPGCNATLLPPVDFETQYRNNNLAFRIPLQMFGLGLIDSIQDSEILSHFNATASQRAALNILGMPNRSGNDGTITRFGWKAQNKSITIFSGEAYNVEMGITNEVFPTQIDETPACNQVKIIPADVVRTDTDDSNNQAFNNPVHEMPDWMEFQLFMRFLDAPQPVAFSASALRGQQVFSTVGCALCHTPSMTTAAQTHSPSLANKQANLYSDLLIHHMGTALADNITQGLAQGDMFRTTPLWGIGQRRFFLHDGRTSDLLAAINAHTSPGNSACNSMPVCYQTSEADAVIKNFSQLPTSDRQAILDFLRSL